MCKSTEGFEMVESAGQRSLSGTVAYSMSTLMSLDEELKRPGGMLLGETSFRVVTLFNNGRNVDRVEGWTSFCKVR